MPEPRSNDITRTHILIIGGDGDLAMRKLYRSLFSLHAAGMLDPVASITGMGRQGQPTEPFRDAVETVLDLPDDRSREDWSGLAPRLFFHTGDATDADSLSRFGEQTDSAGVPVTEDDSVIIYLAVPPKIFGPVCDALQQAGMNTARHRLVIEKPLGNSEQSFLKVDAHLSRAFDESRIFRIDHYLGKESVQNLLALRFSNILFEPMWNSHYIDSVQITVAETVGADQRKAYYNEIGALRDMVQNHLLQILCLVAMEPPVNRSAAMIQAEKLKVIQALAPIDAHQIQQQTVRGQYRAGHVDGEAVSAYAELDPKQPNIDTRHTETYVAIRAHLNSWRWSGVPFYLRTGKRLAIRSSEILIQFKPVVHNIFSASQQINANQLLIRLQPDDGIALRVQHKRPGFSQHNPLQEVSLNLSSPHESTSRTYDAYARLLLDIIHDDQRLFVSAAEVQAAWQWIDRITEHWQQTDAPIHGYKSGSMGPDQAIAMLARDHRQWATLGQEFPS